LSDICNVFKEKHWNPTVFNPALFKAPFKKPLKPMITADIQRLTKYV
jgi:hypothetical protein